MKKIVVTGGSGFIGTNFVKKLTKENCIIHNIDKLSSISTPERFKNKKSFKNYYFYKLDLLNFKKTKKLIFNIKPDFIINFAAESHVDRSIESPIFFLKNNFISSINLFSIFKDYLKKNKNSRLIHISTDEVFGSNNSTPSKENSTYKPSSPYSSSKASADLVALSFNPNLRDFIVISSEIKIPLKPIFFLIISEIIFFEKVATLFLSIFSYKIWAVIANFDEFDLKGKKSILLKSL